MYRRDAEKHLKSLAKDYPVVTVIGPRQSGKTTLVQHVFPDKPYANLEELDAREMAATDPRSFLAQFPDGAVIDEIQQVPELLSYIQVLVDKKNIPGFFILTGSHQYTLHHAVAQSLAGRTALLDLLPMSLQELSGAGIDLSLEKALLCGGYPRIFAEELNPTQAYRDYFRTYIERDLRQMIHLQKLSQFQRFVRLCAGRVGQLLKIDRLANDVGVSSRTINEWLSLLEASYLIVRLQPYFENFGKRMTKAPKLYFTDVGLACYLLGIENETQVSRDPLYGSLVENLVVLELMKARLNQGRDPQLYFYRDGRGHEVDLIYKTGHQLIPIEIKAGRTYNSDFLKNLHFFQALAGERCPVGYLIYTGSQEPRIQTFQLLNYTHASQIFDTEVQ